MTKITAKEVPAITETDPPVEPQPEEAGVPAGFDLAWEANRRTYGECYDHAGRSTRHVRVP